MNQPVPHADDVDVVELRVPCKAEWVALARLSVAAVASRLHFSIDEIEDIKLAVAEACTNAIQHAPRPMADGRFPMHAVLQVQYEKTRKPLQVPDKWDQEFAHYLGWLTGDGCIDARGANAVTVYGSDEDKDVVLHESCGDFFRLLKKAYRGEAVGVWVVPWIDPPRLEDRPARRLAVHVPG